MVMVGEYYYCLTNIVDISIKLTELTVVGDNDASDKRIIVQGL